MASIDEIEIADEAARWAALGFELDGDICRLGAVNVRLSGAQEGEGLSGWSLREIATDELDGLSTSRSGAAERNPAPPHPNGVRAIDHVVAFSPTSTAPSRCCRAPASICDGSASSRRPQVPRARRSSGSGRRSSRSCRSPSELLERSGGAGGPARLWGLALRADDVDGAAAAIRRRGAAARRGPAGAAHRDARARRGAVGPVALISAEAAA